MSTAHLAETRVPDRREDRCALAAGTGAAIRYLNRRLGRRVGENASMIGSRGTSGSCCVLAPVSLYRWRYGSRSRSTLPGYDFLRERVDSFLDLLSEGRHLDFKESQPYDVLRYKIIKASLAMSNVRNGGVVIIGVTERGSEWSLDGITEADLATYDVDVVLDHVHAHASPEVGIDVVKHVRDGKTYLVIDVHEFQSDIVICRKNGPQGEGIEKGRVYIRPAGKAQSRVVETSEEMREITDLATEKKARQMIAASERIGMVASTGATEKFDEELGDL